MGRILLLVSVLACTTQSLTSADSSVQSGASFPLCPQSLAQGEARRRVCKNVRECKTVCQKQECTTKYVYRDV